MVTREERSPEMRHFSLSLPLTVTAFAVPLFIWSAFNADYFDLANENYIIPLAVFFAGPVGLIAAMWAFYHKETYMATVASLFGAFWLSYGMLLWLIDQGVVPRETSGDLRGFFFIPWAVTFGIVWLASMYQHWTMALVTMGATVMFILLSIGYYADSTNILRIGGWVGFVTAGLAWYSMLAEMLNVEFKRLVLPTDLDWFIRRGLRPH
ncbi:MAG TPA: acetate uptake transporter [Dehalococcoidia bacterium]|nr:acetate uptake transporter [Dehalococcoidia bacterium]